MDKKLDATTCEWSTTELREYSQWSVGRETRCYMPPGVDDMVTIHLHMWASNDDAREWPECFFEAAREGMGIHLARQPLTGGKIPESDLERLRQVCPGDSPVGYAWAYVLDHVEQYL